VSPREDQSKATDEAPNAAASGPVIVASNRLPFTVTRTGSGLERRPSAGGLVSALQPVLRKRGGTWVGWPGIDLHEGEEIPQGEEPYRVAPVHISHAEITRYYHGLCNGTLWPLFHSLPQHASFVRKNYDTYEAINHRFADTVVAEAEPADLIWLHDYQLLLAPSPLRKALPDAKLAFFLHIPFPSFDIFRLMPWDGELLNAMLSCDLIGFHVMGYAQNFLDCVERRLGARVDRDAMIIEHGDRAVRVGAFPIGIEFGDFEEAARKAPRHPQRERIVLGVDRLDYTKGIPERMKAFQRLLELHPEHREKVVMLQIAVPSRSQVSSYRDLKREIDELVGQINGRFATANWSPIRYLYRSIPQDKLAAIYRDADVALVTPLRDGMNLVAKEFVAAQVDEPGVLVLSRLAGAAETMREALAVNPYDVDRTAESIHRALTMDEGERRSRIAALRRRERRENVHEWVHKVLDAAASGRAALAPLAGEDFEGWLGPFLNRPKLALFLDYDGTLSPLCEHPSKALLSKQMRAALEACADRPDTDVAIVSGRSLSDVRNMVGYPDLTYAGNHGLQIAGATIPDFEHEDLVHYQARTQQLVAELEELTGDGAWTEAKGPTLTFHYREAPPERRSDLRKRVSTVIAAAGFQARRAHLAIEARPPIGWDKGRAVLHILRQAYGLSWSEQVRVIYVGDDQTDEDAFRFLAGLSHTFRVGPADSYTAATRRLPDVGAVQSLLEWLARRRPLA
jgi:trehalose 6-phosphate synthase/phosphatase